jgi:hypothetical protein
VIHGRLLGQYYNLPVTPDTPGASTDKMESTCYAIIGDLFIRNTAFGPLIPDLLAALKIQPDSIQAKLYKNVNSMGGMGMACQLFALLPLNVMAFWSWLSDKFFVGENNDDDDYNGMTFEPPEEGKNIGEDDDGNMYVEPLPEDDYERNRIDDFEMYQQPQPHHHHHQTPSSIMTDMFFTPPFAHVDRLRDYVLERLRAIKSYPNAAFKEVMENIKEQLKSDKDKQAHWKSHEREIQEKFFKPGVDVSFLYAEQLSKVVSPHDISRRLRKLLQNYYYHMIRAPTIMYKIYGQILRLDDYTPDGLQTSLKETRERHLDLEQTQDHLQRVVYRQGRWIRPADSPTVNRAVLMIIANALPPVNFQPPPRDQVDVEAEEAEKNVVNDYNFDDADNEPDDVDFPIIYHDQVKIV